MNPHKIGHALSSPLPLFSPVSLSIWPTLDKIQLVSPPFQGPSLILVRIEGTRDVARLVKELPTSKQLPGFVHHHCVKACTEVQGCDYSTLELQEAGHPQLRSKREASLSCLRLCINVRWAALMAHLLMVSCWQLWQGIWDPYRRASALFWLPWVLHKSGAQAKCPCT